MMAKLLSNSRGGERSPIYDSSSPFFSLHFAFSLNLCYRTKLERGLTHGHPSWSPWLSLSHDLDARKRRRKSKVIQHWLHTDIVPGMFSHTLHYKIITLLSKLYTLQFCFLPEKKRDPVKLKYIARDYKGSNYSTWDSI